MTSARVAYDIDDENIDPNPKMTSNRKSPRSGIKSRGFQPTLSEMFGKKRPREEENPPEENSSTKVKIDNDLEIKEKIEAKAEIKTVMAEINGNIDKELLVNGCKDVGTAEDAAVKEEEKSMMVEEKEICPRCGSDLADPELKFFQGHPQDSVEEYIALTDDKLVVTGEDDIMERPHLNITGYSVYDRDGHLCPIDGGLIESDVRLLMSGYLKSICSESPDLDGDCVPVKDAGPIIEWFIHGFDGGMNNCLTLSTEYAEYNLLQPSEEYAPFMDNLYERIRLSKVTVEYLEDFHYLEPTYEDLLSIIKENSIPELGNKMMTEEMLHKHARFICDQVASLEAEDTDEPPLVTLPCIRELIKLFGIKFGKNKTRGKIQYKKKTAAPWSKATTTPLVRKTFETFFLNQLDKNEKDFAKRRKRCEICDMCQLPDCGTCTACKAMGKFGGSGKTKKACLQRRCPNMAVQEAEESDPEDEEVYRQLSEKFSGDVTDEVATHKKNSGDKRDVLWLDEPTKKEKTRTYYERVQVGDMAVKVGDYVMVDTIDPSIPHLIVLVHFMWEEQGFPGGFFHGQMFMRSSETVLGEISNPREVFMTDICAKRTPLSSILRPAVVEQRLIPDNWFKLGGLDDNIPEDHDDGKTYFFQKYIKNKNFARFEDLPPPVTEKNEQKKHCFCPACHRKTLLWLNDLPKVSGPRVSPSKYSEKNNRWEWESVMYKGVNYKRGMAIFLETGTFTFKTAPKQTKSKQEKVDEVEFSEYYRKSDTNKSGSNEDTDEPYCIGFIDAILATTDSIAIAPQEFRLKVNIMYRPEHTCLSNPEQQDLNLVYWSDDQREVLFDNVIKPCILSYEENIDKTVAVTEWSEKNSDRFYFKEAFDKKQNKICKVPDASKSVGDSGDKKGKGKGKGKSSKVLQENEIKEEEVNVRPLRTLDVFAGCGGLSEGLHQSGVAVNKWAIESCPPAAKAFQLNNPNCIVYTEDCNTLLQAALSGSTHAASGQLLPLQGEVELLCGGPPCQGFSGMNRFNSREYSNFKNSLVASYLSYCDYYRPKYFILENVRNFVAFKKSMVLKLTLKCLLQIGYQCTFGILQAGNYGVPQTRRRLIIFAAAPGYELPVYPEPTHVFSKRATNLFVMVDGKRYLSHNALKNSAPRRTCTIRDAMSDLPLIPNGAFKSEVEYGSVAQSDFQRHYRTKDGKVRDHICKNMAPLIQARMSRIPPTPGADWRDLPNIAVTLSDGTRSKVLQYRYHDIKNGRSSSGALRGVCSCAAGKGCSPGDKQDNTLIPWCLPHTGNRHNHWAGLYGRLAWDGFFSTTITDPEPMGKQGRVLHPEQNRVVSVRECARSQGFPDSYIFSGSIQDKHRQVGNAVPPPLGAALGYEIKKALVASSALKI